MKRSIATLIVAASLMVSNQGSAEEIKEAFGISLGDKLDLTNFTRVKDDSNSSYPSKRPKSHEYKYIKNYDNDVLKKIEVFTDIDGIVLSINAVSAYMNYEECDSEGTALAKSLYEKYGKGKLDNYRFFLKNEKTRRYVSGGCHMVMWQYHIFYEITDVKLTDTAQEKWKRIEAQQVKDRGKKYKSL